MAQVRLPDDFHEIASACPELAALAALLVPEFADAPLIPDPCGGNE